ncbi:MAG: hypothetical protein WA101_03095 [Minisyncoccia bacterium]
MINKKEPITLIQCKKPDCRNYKFVCGVWNKPNNNMVAFLEKQLEKGRCVVHNDAFCPSCTPEEIYISSEPQPGDIIQKSGDLCEKT